MFLHYSLAVDIDLNGILDYISYSKFNNEDVFYSEYLLAVKYLIKELN